VGVRGELHNYGVKNAHIHSTRRPSVNMLGGGKWNRRFFSIQGTDLIYQTDDKAPIKGSVDLKVFFW